MALEDYKITDSDISTKGVIAAPDKLTGTAAENKSIFDRLIREPIKSKLNGLVEYLISGTEFVKTIEQELTEEEKETARNNLGVSGEAVAVNSVNGKTGAVVLNASDVNAQSLIKKVAISLPAASWTGSASPFSQVITIQGTTANTKVDLEPNNTAYAHMISAGCQALYVVNNNNVLTAYAIEAKPTIDLTIQGTIYEVEE